MRSITHKTGYLYQAQDWASRDGTFYEFVESWHRTYTGAQKAKVANRGRGDVYKITSDDTSYKAQA